MSGTPVSTHKQQKGETPIAAERAALWMSEEEAEALLTLLLQVADTTAVAPGLTDRLLCRVAEVQREFVRLQLPDASKTASAEKTPMPRRRVVRPVPVRRKLA